MTAAVELAAERYPIFGDDHLSIDSRKTEERDLGWLYYVQSNRFLETREASAEIMAVTPIFVHRQSGTPTWVKRFGPSDFIVNGQPAPDWPPLAFIAVPAAIIALAAAWTSIWWGLSLVGRTTGFVLFGFIALVVMTAVAVIPADRIIAWARFRNFSRWGGLVLVLAGIGLANALSARIYPIPRVDLMLGQFGLAFDVPMELLELFVAAGMATAGTFIGQRSKVRRDAWEASRVISAPAEHDEDKDEISGGDEGSVGPA